MKRSIQGLKSACKALLFVIEETVPAGPDRDEAIASVRSAFYTGRDAIRAEFDRIDLEVEEYNEAEARALGDRLFYDEHSTCHSPTVRGTFVTVSQVIGLLNSGMGFETLLRTHPELTEDDIQACIDFNVFTNTAREAA